MYIYIDIGIYDLNDYAGEWWCEYFSSLDVYYKRAVAYGVSLKYVVLVKCPLIKSTRESQIVTKAADKLNIWLSMRNFTRRVLQLGRLGLFLYSTSIESRNALTNLYVRFANCLLTILIGSYWMTKTLFRSNVITSFSNPCTYYAYINRITFKRIK